MLKTLKASVNRRRFLELTSSTMIGTVLGSTAYLGSTRSSRAAVTPSRDIENSYELRVTRVPDPDDPDADKFLYNGNTTGPTIKAFPGETIKVELINDMPVLDPGDDCPSNINEEHGANTTNLHTHGLHVSPNVSMIDETFDADNIFLKVVPEGQPEDDCDDENFRYGRNTYRFDLPPNHPSGTHWYHAHKHGSTNDQVSGGLAGAIIIEDDPEADDPMPRPTSPTRQSGCSFSRTAQP